MLCSICNIISFSRYKEPARLSSLGKLQYSGIVGNETLINKQFTRVFLLPVFLILSLVIPGFVDAQVRSVDESAKSTDCAAKDEEGKSHYEYAAKFICGVQRNTRSMRLARGFYATIVNIHNPNAGVASLRDKIALAFPPANTDPGQILTIGEQRLKYDEAASIDCDYIKRNIFSGQFPAGYIDGYLVIQSDKSLDVDAVHTTANLNAEGTAEDHSSILVTRIPERLIKSSTPPQEKPDLIVRDIDPSSIRVSCPTGQGSCVTRVNVTVANVGSGTATGFTTRIMLDPQQSVVVNDDTPGGLNPGATKTIDVETPPGGNCFDPDCTVCAIVDSLNEVDETDETNNSLCRRRPG